jgi:hypothetical protein
MSGEKDRIVFLTESEHARMMDSVLEVDRQREIQNQMAEANAELEYQIKHVAKQHQRQMDNFEERLADTSEYVQNLEHDFNQKLKDYDQKLEATHQQMQEMGEHIGKRIDGLDRKIESTREFLQGQIQATRQHLQAEIDTVNQRIRQKEINEEQAARTWLNDVRIIIDATRNTYDHQKFMPGVLDRLNAELVLVESNLSAGHFQAAIAKSQESFLKAQELRLELEMKTRQWNTAMLKAEGFMKQALVHLDTLEASQLSFDTEDGAVKLDAQVDYWTQGDLTELKNKMVAYQQQLQSGALNIDELEQLLPQLNQITQEAEALWFRTREAIVASQLRNNIAQTIESSLMEAGWEVTDSAYAGEELDENNGFANAYHVKLANLAGDEMVTIIMPEETVNGTIANKLRMSFHPKASADARQNARQAEHIGDVLRSSGLETGKMSCAPGTESTERGRSENLDFESVRRQPKRVKQKSAKNFHSN